MNCPRCDAPLESHSADDIAVAACIDCGGVWLDNAGSQKIVRDIAPAVEQLAESLSEHRARAVDLDSGGLACPVCHAPLQHQKLRGNVQLDLCLAHGTWFDAFELREVMTLQRDLAETVAQARPPMLVVEGRERIAERTFDGNDEYGRAAGALRDAAADAATSAFWTLVFGLFSKK